MKFKELAIHATFEFDYSGLPLCHGPRFSPWVKISARKYILSTNPFSNDPIEQQRHQEHHGFEYQVGSINAKVVLE